MSQIPGYNLSNIFPSFSASPSWNIDPDLYQDGDYGHYSGA